METYVSIIESITIKPLYNTHKAIVSIYKKNSKFKIL